MMDQVSETDQYKQLCAELVLHNKTISNNLSACQETLNQTREAFEESNQVKQKLLGEIKKLHQRIKRLGAK